MAKVTLPDGSRLEMAEGSTAKQVAEKIGTDNKVNAHIILQLLQYRHEAAQGNLFSFAGGTTLIVDAKTLEVEYSILKNIASKTRLAKAREAMTAARGLHPVYLSQTPFDGMGERFAVVHKSGSEV